MYIYKPTYKDRKTGKQKKQKVWWAKFYVGVRCFRKSTGTSDKRAAELKAAEMVKRQELRAAGIETHDETRTATPTTLAAEYRAELIRRGRSKEHVETTNRRVLPLLDGLGALARATSEELRRRLGRLQETDDVAPQTVNAYRPALYGFFQWLQREGRWRATPLDAVPRVGAPEKTFDRRALTPEELGRLVEAAPFERAVCYLTAATTGLRRGELESLEWSRVDLEAGVVTVRASQSKNRREAVLPLAPVTVEALRAWRARQGVAGDGRVFHPRADDLPLPMRPGSRRHRVRDRRRCGRLPRPPEHVRDLAGAVGGLARPGPETHAALDARPHGERLHEARAPRWGGREDRGRPPCP